AIERQLTFPEDDPDEFYHILHHLKGWGPNLGYRYQEGVPNLKDARFFAQLYITADKYILEELKKQIRFPPIAEHWHRMEEWITIAEAIYSIIPRSDDIFPKTFRRWVTEYFEHYRNDRERLGFLDRYIERGGRIAVDISGAIIGVLRQVVHNQIPHYVHSLTDFALTIWVQYPNLHRHAEPTSITQVRRNPSCANMAPHTRSTAAAAAAVAAAKQPTKLFLIIAGPKEREFVVSETLLKNSPVFARMCEGDFKEAQEQQIFLPEDDPEHIDYMFKYLRTGYLSVPGRLNRRTKEGRLDVAWWKARLYLVADKYELPDLQKAIAKDYEREWWELAIDDWLTLAEDMYATIPTDDVFLRPAIRSIVGHYSSIYFYESRAFPDFLDVFDKWIEKGGPLATGLSRTLKKHLSRRYKKAVRETRETEEQLKDEHERKMAQMNVAHQHQVTQLRQEIERLRLQIYGDNESPIFETSLAIISSTRTRINTIFANMAPTTRSAAASAASATSTISTVPTAPTAPNASTTTAAPVFRFAAASRPFSRVFTVTAGPAKQEFTIAENLLKKSPVFARICDSGFKESHKQRINLPEDDPVHIKHIIKFLETGRLAPFPYGTDPAPKPGDPDRYAAHLDSAWWKARLYLTADKYGMEDMKKSIAMTYIPSWKYLAMDDWLAFVESMYETLPKDDEWFPWLVGKTIMAFCGDDIFLRRNYPDGLEVLDKWIEKGGKLGIQVAIECKRCLMGEMRRRNDKLEEFRKAVPESVVGNSMRWL
ncbi:MAG: hypothetical protein Q9218_007128, partial [Villophora microphyllina]